MSERMESAAERSSGSYYLEAILRAIKEKDLAVLRTVVDGLQLALDEKKMAAPVSDNDLETLVTTGKGCLYVGSGSAGTRVYIENGEVFMPVSETDEAQGIGKRCQDNFRRIFNISEVQELRAKFPGK